jgi:hypothetical protein
MSIEAAAELSVMKLIAEALDPLEQAVQERIASWTSARYGGEGARSLQNAARPNLPAAETAPQNRAAATFAELFDQASPRSEKEKALVAAFWAHECKGQDAFASQALNAELKNLGHGIGNIADALSGLIAESPALILQIKKAGKTKQARKLYKISEAGKRRVREMISTA